MADLLALSRAEGEVAKRLRAQRAGAHALTFALAVAGLFLPAPMAYYFALGAFLSEAAAWWLRHRAMACHQRAEEGRRRALLTAALGSDPETLEAVDLAQRFSKRARGSAHAHADPGYWSTSQAPGPARLREALQESAFWSTHLYRAAAKWGFAIAGAVAGLAALGALVVALSQPGEVGEAITRVCVVILTAVIATDVLTDALGWLGASRAAHRVDRRIAASDFADQAVVLAIFADYATATEAAAPIPTRLYKREHDRLVAAWAARTGGSS